MLMARPCVLAPKPGAWLWDVSLSGPRWGTDTELTATSAPASRSIDFMIISADLGWVLDNDHLGRDIASASALTAARGNVASRALRIGATDEAAFSRGSCRPSGI